MKEPRIETKDIPPAVLRKRGNSLQNFAVGRN